MNRLHVLLCLFTFIAGCDASAPPPLTPEAYKVQYEARQAIAEAAAKAKLEPKIVVIPGVKYERKMTIVCLQGVQYYYAESGWSIWFAPVYNRTSGGIVACD